MKKKILFVCSGNICRSPLAHRLFERMAKQMGRDQDFEVDSCGTGAWHEGQNADSRMRQLASDKGWKLEKYARQYRQEDINHFDHILIMDMGHMNFFKNHVRDKDLLSKVQYLREYDNESGGDLKVPDPYYDGQRGFEQVYAMVERSCKAMLAAL